MHIVLPGSGPSHQLECLHSASYSQHGGSLLIYNNYTKLRYVLPRAPSEVHTALACTLKMERLFKPAVVIPVAGPFSDMATHTGYHCHHNLLRATNRFHSMVNYTLQKCKGHFKVAMVI